MASHHGRPDDMELRAVRPDRGITVRSMALGTALCLVIGIGEPYGVHVIGGSPMCANFSTGGAVFLMFLVVLLLNPLLKLISTAYALNSREMIVIYIMMVVASAIPSWGFTLNVIALISGLSYFSTPENDWARLYQPYIRDWMKIDPEICRYVYEGLPKQIAMPWRPWLMPLLGWTVFIVAVYLVTISAAVIVRRRWMEHEVLTYPLTILPLAMTEESPKTYFPPLLKSGLMWMGFAIPFVVYSLRGLHSYFHIFPEIRLHTYVNLLGTHWMMIGVFIQAIGFAYLLPADLSLGIWFFALLANFQTAFYRRIGVTIGPVEWFSDPSGPIAAYQAQGALFVLVIFMLWNGREHLRNVLRKAIKSDPSIDDQDEIMSYKGAFWCFFLSNVFVVYWLIMGFGMPIFTAIFFWIVALILFVGLTRAVAQGGLAYGRAPVISPVFTANTLGSSVIGNSGATAMALHFAWAADVRTFVMASAANSLKMVGVRKLRRPRRIFWAILLAIVATLLSSYWITIRIGYQYGGINLMGWQFRGITLGAFGWFQPFVTMLKDPNVWKIICTGIGALVMWLLMTIRYRFAWWPLHPLGYAIGSPRPVADWIWFSIFLAWLAKVTVMKIGGAKLYRKMIPFFLGLILGGFATAGMWLIIDGIAGGRGNWFTPG